MKYKFFKKSALALALTLTLTLTLALGMGALSICGSTMAGTVDLSVWNNLEVELDGKTYKVINPAYKDNLSLDFKLNSKEWKKVNGKPMWEPFSYGQKTISKPPLPLGDMKLDELVESIDPTYTWGEFVSGKGNIEPGWVVFSAHGTVRGSSAMRPDNATVVASFATNEWPKGIDDKTSLRDVLNKSKFKITKCKVSMGGYITVGCEGTVSYEP